MRHIFNVYKVLKRRGKKNHRKRYFSGKKKKNIRDNIVIIELATNGDDLDESGCWNTYTDVVRMHEYIIISDYFCFWLCGKSDLRQIVN